MKKILFLSMGLLACLAFSPQRAFSAPDTGPKMDNIEVVDNTSAPAADHIAIMAMDEESTSTSTISSYEQIYGRETVPEPSDHTFSKVSYFVNYVLVNNGEQMIVSDELLPLAAMVDPERRTCASNNVMKYRYNLDLENSTGLPLVGYAQHSRQMVLVLCPTWMPPHYLRA